MFDLSDTTSVGSPGFGSPILGGSQSSLTGHSSAPELLISLCYASLTGRLTVEVLKASNLRHLQLQRAPGMYLPYLQFYSFSLVFSCFEPKVTLFSRSAKDLSVSILHSP